MYRVIELVKTGKNIQLLCISRASSRAYFNKAVLLEWKGGKIVDSVLLPDHFSKTKYLESIHRELG
jgi:hypothetical protein